MNSVRAAAREAALREIKERAKAKQVPLGSRGRPSAAKLLRSPLLSDHHCPHPQQAEKKKAATPKAPPPKQVMPKGGKQSKATNKQGAKGVRR